MTIIPVKQLGQQQPTDVARAQQTRPPGQDPALDAAAPKPQDGAQKPQAESPSYPTELADAESALIAARRAAIGQEPDTPKIGVGLSGGGIRSATFCNGVFQALARSRQGDRPLLSRIDYLSTVSGGGYFGSFLGSLYRRGWAQSHQHVADVVQGDAGPADGRKPARFLRDNGRYLAPRGSGDLLVMLAVILRNLVAVQCVMIAFVLTAFLLLQLVRMTSASAVEGISAGLAALSSWLPGFLSSWAQSAAESVTALRSAVLDLSAPAFGGLWWSAWFLVLIPIAMWAIPAAWAYWVIGQPLSVKSAFRRSDLIVLAAAASALLFGLLPEQFRIFVWVIALLAFLTALYATWIQPPAFVRAILKLLPWRKNRETKPLDDANAARRRISAAFKNALVAGIAMTLIAFIDTLGATAYLILSTKGFLGLATAMAGVLGVFAGIAAYGRQFLVLFGGSGRDGRPRVSMSIVSWIVAILVVGAWLAAVNAGSHAIAWGFRAPAGYPETLLREAAPKLADAQQVIIEERADGRTIRTLPASSADVPPATSSAGPDQRDANDAQDATRDFRTAGYVFVCLLALVWVLGGNRSFINLSTMHTFYAQRLTRAYLGATNEKRLCDAKAHVTDVIEGDDIAADEYWNWPRTRHEGMMESIASKAKAAGSFIASLPKKTWHFVVRMFTGKEAPTSEPPAPDQETKAAADLPGHHGAPLHIVNVTINETFDNSTGIQRQDRKGVPLAVGPAGFSVGVRHHLVADKQHKHIALPKEGAGHKVFEKDALVADPEVMSLGRWVSISGAAAAAAAGSRTTLPVALLATLANVRLGYWWDSGLSHRGKTTILRPVYRALFAECLARVRGTGDRLWNLSDGGHFENLGGYELIRRRLPLIILIDAEQDADYTFAGLADLVRKARLDFDAEIEFLSHDEIHTLFASRQIDIHNQFGTLADLRRLNLADMEFLPSNTGLENASKRQNLSRAHAAIARVTYLDDKKSPPSWLVYVKATLTGDEPVDVLEYHSKHPDFPHDTTANQFFDEAQWESYRRLGEHIGSRVLTPAIFDLAGPSGGPFPAESGGSPAPRSADSERGVPLQA